ncbi:GNAT family N-acetyltransferase [Neorhizobium sp. JUb45]|uniref:GNAT family N-acetyltransferase n=1 Tax=unclassified Neorhizobium TaxID=2629175 RepID=UPI001049D563|nr:GNAT family N-acetyltransferase [Neorhizobium sp. JUb45]TCR06861.1 acetyltransferase (GNAT) family protein [Neorhizobium sp. JUb45]
MAEELVIRAAGSDDLTALLALYRHLGHDDPVVSSKIAEERFSTILAQPGMTVLIGFQGDKAVATITLVVVPNLTRNACPYALIENVVTHAAHRQQGHGSQLIRHAIEMAWQADCYKVMLLTGSTNPSTLRFYEDCGFERSKTGFQIRRS